MGVTVRWLKGKKQELDNKDHTPDPTDEDKQSVKSGKRKEGKKEKLSKKKGVKSNKKDKASGTKKEENHQKDGETGTEEDGDEKSEGNSDSEKDDQTINPVLLAYPVRNDLVDWEMDDNGIITIIYTKNFGKFERWLHKKIGGPSRIRRPLDEPGSRMWSMCDGRHTIMEICAVIDKEFKEEMDPVFRKVRMFLEQLLILNLIVLESKEERDKKKAEEDEDQDESSKDNDSIIEEGEEMKEKIGDGEDKENE